MQGFRSIATYIGVVLFVGLSSARAGDEAWYATEMLMPGDVVHAENVQLRSLTRPIYGALSADKNPVGLEVKHHVVAGHPLTVHDVGPICLVHANETVQVHWRVGNLSMVLSGRALEPGAAGQEIRVLNPSTSRTISGIVVGPDTLEIQPNQ